jgi:hypothetical protein
MAVFSVIYSIWLGYYRNVDHTNLSNKESSIENGIFFQKIWAGVWETEKHYFWAKNGILGGF